MDQEGALRKRLNFLIENSLLSSDMLAAATSIEKDVLEKYLLGKCNVLSKNDMEDCKRRLRLASITDLLIEGMLVSEDDRVRGIVDVLIQIYEMNYEMLAKYTGLDKEEIINFVNRELDMSCEKKYNLAVKVFSLIQVMKNM